MNGLACFLSLDPKTNKFGCEVIDDLDRPNGITLSPDEKNYMWQILQKI